MLNVLSIVSYNFLPAKMGGQKGIALFNQFFAKQVNLHCATVSNNKVDGNEGYRIFNILSNSKLRYINVFYFFTIKKIIKHNNISHLIIEHPYYGWLGILLQKFCGVKMIVHSHNIEALRFKSVNKWWWKILWQYEKMVHNSADFNFFITEVDKQYALENFNLSPTKCEVITYGFDLEKAPLKEEKSIAKKSISAKHNFNEGEITMLFNGTLSYKPNEDALNIILEKINPILLNNPSFKYKIIVCGKGLSESYHNLENYKTNNVVYAGFVDEVSIYFKAADIFINPVIDGGGIKTKIVEALGFNVSLVTTESGAIGIPQEITGLKMKIIDDNNWDDFAKAIMEIDIATEIPNSYFEYFYWGNIAQKAVNAIEKI